MIPLTFLYDEYIDRPKFTEQKKKKPFEYIVPSPTSGVGTIRLNITGKSPISIQMTLQMVPVSRIM